jgi:ABC-type sugar transport system ATPase subunit
MAVCHPKTIPNNRVRAQQCSSETVTHDQVEAMSLSDRIAVLDRGRIQQVGSPDDVYHRPINRFVAEFIGSPPMNIIDAELTEVGGRISLMGPGFNLPVDESAGQRWRRAKLPRELVSGSDRSESWWSRSLQMMPR